LLAGARSGGVFNFLAYRQALDPDVTYDDAVALIQQAAPRDWAIHGESIERNLVRAKTPKFKHKYFMEDFLKGPLPLPAGKSIFLHGPSRVGKTHYACAHFQNPLLVCDMDDLKSFKPTKHDGIVFDDMSFLHIPPEKVIHLVDQELTRTIRCRHSNATLPAFTPKIFTHNCSNPFFGIDGPMAATPEQGEAIANRLEAYRVPFPLFKGAANPVMQLYSMYDGHDIIRPSLVRTQERIYHCDGNESMQVED